MNVILYSTQFCPRCKVLKSKLEAKNIEYKEENDVNKMQELGISFIPCIQIDNGKIMEFSEANKWVNEQEVVK